MSKHGGLQVRLCYLYFILFNWDLSVFFLNGGKVLSTHAHFQYSSDSSLVRLITLCTTAEVFEIKKICHRLDY